jgi:hypothetical protein
MVGSDPDEPEPRFAGSAPAGYQPPAAYIPVMPNPVPTSAPPTSPPPPFPPADLTGPTWPEVSYSGAFPPPEVEAEGPALQVWFAPLLGVVGAILAIVGSQLTWATLQEASESFDSASGTDQTTSVAYDGMTLLEGRVTLVLGVAAVIFSVLIFLRRRLGITLAVIGGAGLATAVLAAAAHPVELSTLFRSYRDIEGVKVQLPNGPGVWLAIAGSVLILGGGLLAYFWRDRPDPPATANELPDE